MLTTVGNAASGDSVDGAGGNDILILADSDNTLSVANIETVIGGGGGNDVLFGDDGDDILSAGGGSFNDLVGGAGADTLIGGTGIDTAHYTVGSETEGVTVNLASGTGLGGEAEGDTLEEIENIHGSIQDDTLIGDDGNNLLVGFAGVDELAGDGGDDHLDGGEGEDFIAGGSGDDQLTGGADNDAFLFNTGDQQASITDFLEGDEIILLGVTAVEFLSGGSIVGGFGGDRITFDDGTGDGITIDIVNQSLGSEGYTINEGNCPGFLVISSRA